MAISVSEMTPTNQTDVILEGLRVLVPLRASEETLDSLTIEELVHLFNLYIDVLHEGQRDTIIKYVLHCVYTKRKRMRNIFVFAAFNMCGTLEL